MQPQQNEPTGDAAEKPEAATAEPEAAEPEAGEPEAGEPEAAENAGAGEPQAEPVAGTPIEPARAEGFASGIASAQADQSNQADEGPRLIPAREAETLIRDAALRHNEEVAFNRANPALVMSGTPEPRTAGLTFSGALHALKAGLRVARHGWNGKGMFLFLVSGSTFQVNREPLLSILGVGVEVNYQPHIDMYTAAGTVVPWLASQSDLLSGDWYIIEAASEAQPDAAA